MTTTAPRTQAIGTNILVENTLANSDMWMLRFLTPMTQLNSELESRLSQ
jgi:hypothetical protein